MQIYDDPLDLKENFDTLKEQLATELPPPGYVRTQASSAKPKKTGLKKVSLSIAGCALAAAVVVGGIGVVGTTESPASALQQLSAAALAPVESGQLLYQVTSTDAVMGPESGSIEVESWLTSSGERYIRQPSLPFDGPNTSEATWVITNSEGDWTIWQGDNPSPDVEFNTGPANEVPTDLSELDAYLNDGLVSDWEDPAEDHGLVLTTPQEKALFILSHQNISPAQRSALFDWLGQNESIVVDENTQDSGGRPAVSVATSNEDGSSQTLYFDDQSGATLEWIFEGIYQGEPHSGAMTTTTLEYISATEFPEDAP